MDQELPHQPQQVPQQPPPAYQPQQSMHYQQPPVPQQQPMWQPQPQMMAPQPQMIPHHQSHSGQQQQQVVQQVVINQPGQPRNLLLVGTRNGTRDWTTGLCGCCEDVGSCCLTFWCSSASVCTLAVRVGDSFCMPACVPDSLFALRVRVRTLGDIKGSIGDDWRVTSCCGPCAVCQMHRELDAMGL